MRTIIFLALSAVFSATASAEILFEGIFAKERDGRRTGYMIQRVEFDAAAKKRTITTYSRTARGSSGIEEFSVSKSVAGEDFMPIEFSYRSVGDDVDETTKAEFKGKKKIDVNAYFGKNKTAERLDSYEVPEGSMLGAFVYYLIDLMKLPTGKEQSYVAFAESSGRYSEGRLRLDGSKKKDGVTIYQLQDFFEGEDIESFVFANGDPAGARNADEKSLVYLVSHRDDAVKGFEFPQKEIIEIFGDLPEGQKNPMVAAGGKLNVAELIKSFPIAKPTREPQGGDPDEEENKSVMHDIRVPMVKH